MLRGQSTLEYVYILAICIVALVGVSIYINRGFQGRYRDLGEQMGPQYSPTTTALRSTSEIFSDTTSTSTSKVKKLYSDFGVSVQTQSQENETSGWNRMITTTREGTGSLEDED
ncbi:MAG: hypothetical protein WC364_14510 [Eubacteriales bacterium]|jgi:hypothetical protein